jgi:hypothetical protein
MWSLTSRRMKRISGFKKIRLVPLKDFFDSIGQTRKSALAIAMSALPPIATKLRTSREVRFVPILLQKSVEDFREQ